MDPLKLVEVKGQGQVNRAARRDFDEGLRALVERIVVGLVGQVLPIEFQAQGGVDSGLGEGVEPPIGGQEGRVRDAGVGDAAVRSKQ